MKPATAQELIEWIKEFEEGNSKGLRHDLDFACEIIDACHAFLEAMENENESTTRE